MPYFFDGGIFMAGVSKAISDELFFEAQNSLKELGKAGEISRKLQAIIAAKKFGVTLAAKVFGTSRPSIMSWIKNFKQDAEDGLKIKVGRGRKSSINYEIRENVAKFMQQNPNTTINGLREFIKKKHGISISSSSGNRLLKQINLSYITPRPIHYKSDIAAQEDFKKNFKN